MLYFYGDFLQTNHAEAHLTGLQRGDKVRANVHELVEVGKNAVQVRGGEIYGERLVENLRKAGKDVVCLRK